MSQLCVGQESKYKLYFAAMCLEHVQHEAHSCKRKYVLACHTIGERTVCCGLKLDYAPWEMPCWGAESFALQWTVTELMHQNHIPFSSLQLCLGTGSLSARTWQAPVSPGATSVKYHCRASLFVPLP